MNEKKEVKTLKIERHIIRIGKIVIKVMRIRTRSKIIVTAIVIVILLAIGFIGFIPRYRTDSISKYISDGGSVTYTYEGYFSRLDVKLTSTNDYMYLKIIVDGKVVYEKSRIYDVDFEYSAGFGYHVVHIIIENPTIFGLGPTILVAGKVSLHFW